MALSGQRVYESWLYSLFNVCFASLPIVIYAFLDREYGDITLLSYPFLYEKGLKNTQFDPKRFWLWLGNAVWQSVIVGIPA